MFLIDLENMLVEFHGVTWSKLRDKVVFIFDNASIHLTQAVQDYFKKWSLLAFTLPPYTPWFNPIELMFGMVK